MSKIGGAWLNSRELEDGTMRMYYSLVFDEALQPFIITKEKKIILTENKNKGDNEKAPDFIIESYIPKKKNIEQNEKKDVYNEEVPF